MFDVDLFLFVSHSADLKHPIQSIISPGRYQIVLPYRNDLYDLSEILSLINCIQLAAVTSIILRNYLELGNFYLTDRFSSSSLHYCVLGDTHHLSQSLSWCFNCLVTTQPQFFFSRSNPHHAILLANCLEAFQGLTIQHSAAPDYLLVRPDVVHSYPNVSGDYLANLCISNLKVQFGRKRLLRYLLHSPKLLSVTNLFDFMPEFDFRNLLISSSYLFVPGINGQISPQIFYSLSHQCTPIVDCFAALTSSNYHISLSKYLVSLKQVLSFSSFPASNDPSLEVYPLSLKLQTMARSEVSFVQAFLSGEPTISNYFSLLLTRDNLPSQPFRSSIQPLDPSRIYSILQQLDQLKLLSLREPLSAFQQSFELECSSILDVVANTPLQVSVEMAIEALNESRSWLYDCDFA